ncbi:MAG: hypothetical protein LJE69_10680 [Thiohalocapsa sp.]|uniref:hypothetical protein n=1 Tax=Thiohalocapsa sp. TaxID=2497641 RepID=UPI0025E6445E|nr:hypothetical protein [Thiohalocapsa sp.]MCG6941701.1 hypothetical protein [Thiohalocapsa sp.]
MKYAAALAPALLSALLPALLLVGCAGMNNSEQRMVSGAAMGGVVAGPIGAAVGAGAGYIYDRTKSANDY